MHSQARLTLRWVGDGLIPQLSLVKQAEEWMHGDTATLAAVERCFQTDEVLYTRRAKEERVAGGGERKSEG